MKRIVRLPKRKSHKKVHVRWTDVVPVPGSPPQKRYFNIETLFNAITQLFNTHDRVFTPVIQAAMGPVPLGSLNFNVISENAYQLTFHLQAANIRRKRASFRVVIAKNEKECSSILQAEQGHLKILQERYDKGVLAPLRNGIVYLPDHRGRQLEPRELYTYMTRWPGAHGILGIANPRQLSILDSERHVCSVAATGQIQQQMLEILLATYDENERHGLHLPELELTDFVAQYNGKTKTRVWLSNCRKVQSRLPPAKLLHACLEKNWDAPNEIFPLAPEDPRLVWNALLSVLPKEKAANTLREYHQALQNGRLKSSMPEYIDALMQIALS